eukprot:scaffold6029_cov63-Phaeocystis_antarctica.AAC.11
MACCRHLTIGSSFCHAVLLPCARCIIHLHTSSEALGAPANLTAGRPKEVRVCKRASHDGEYGFDDAGERGEPGGAPGDFSPKRSVSRRSLSATLELDRATCSGESIVGRPLIFRKPLSTFCSARRRAAFRTPAAPGDLSPAASSVLSPKLPAETTSPKDNFAGFTLPAAFWKIFAWVRVGVGVRVRVRVRVRAKARARARDRDRVNLGG